MFSTAWLGYETHNYMTNVFWFDFKIMFDQVAKCIGHIKKLEKICMRRNCWLSTNSSHTKLLH